MVFDWISFASIAAITAIGFYVFFKLARRETTQRPRLRLSEWAAANYMRPIDPSLFVPPPLDRLGSEVVESIAGFADARTVVLRCRSSRRDRPEPAEWNVAIRRMSGASLPMGLRPVGAGRSLVDLFDLPHAAHQLAGLRFTVVGEDLRATRTLAEGSTAPLLPAELGLVRVDHWLVLDFSTRPFDPLELSRVLALLDQLAGVV